MCLRRGQGRVGHRRSRLAHDLIAGKLSGEEGESAFPPSSVEYSSHMTHHASKNGVVENVLGLCLCTATIHMSHHLVIQQD